MTNRPLRSHSGGCLVPAWLFAASAWGSGGPDDMKTPFFLLTPGPKKGAAGRVKSRQLIAGNSPRPNGGLYNETNHSVMIGAAPAKLLPVSFHCTKLLSLVDYFGLMKSTAFGWGPTS